eukprot:scaffold14304_cov49-Phaeocystis_antarctica.AAC.1
MRFPASPLTRAHAPPAERALQVSACAHRHRRKLRPLPPAQMLSQTQRKAGAGSRVQRARPCHGVAHRKLAPQLLRRVNRTPPAATGRPRLGPSRQPGAQAEPLGLHGADRAQRLSLRPRHSHHLHGVRIRDHAGNSPRHSREGDLPVLLLHRALLGPSDVAVQEEEGRLARHLLGRELDAERRPLRMERVRLARQDLRPERLSVVQRATVVYRDEARSVAHRVRLRLQPPPCRRTRPAVHHSMLHVRTVVLVALGRRHQLEPAQVRHVEAQHHRNARVGPQPQAAGTGQVGGRGHQLAELARVDVPSPVTRAVEGAAVDLNVNGIRAPALREHEPLQDEDPASPDGTPADESITTLHGQRAHHEPTKGVLRLHVAQLGLTKVSPAGRSAQTSSNHQSSLDIGQVHVGPVELALSDEAEQPRSDVRPLLPGVAHHENGNFAEIVGSGRHVEGLLNDLNVTSDKDPLLLAATGNSTQAPVTHRDFVTGVLRH